MGSGDRAALLPVAGSPPPPPKLLRRPGRCNRAFAARFLLYLCGELRAALPGARLPCAGVWGSCRADFQQRGSAAALRVEQSPRSLTHSFLQGVGRNSAFTIPCLWPRGVLPPRDPRGPWPVPSEGSGARCSSPAPPGAPAAFSDL